VNHWPGDRHTPMRLGGAGLLMLLAWARATTGMAQPIVMHIVGTGQEVSKIAVSQLKNLGGDDDGKVSGQFVHTLSRDLQLSGFFSVIDPKAYIEKPQDSGYALGQFNFADWSSINAEWLVKGAVTANDQQVTVQAFLYDVSGQHQMVGKQYTGSEEDPGRMARRFADAILQQVTSVRGPFDSRLALVSTRGGRFKEIYTMSIDGEDLYRVTNNSTINLFPSFDHRVRHVLYVSYKSGAPGLYLFDLDRRSETHIGTSLGNLIGGTLMPDGNRLVAAVESGGATNLYLLDLHGNVIRQLTRGSAINVGPAVNSDGSQMAFASDRGGTPQVYVMGIDGGAARRLTYKGSYNTNPVFSPKGDQIAYQSREGGGFNIYRIGTGGGSPIAVISGQHPAWSPDGRYIAFSIGRGSGIGLYLIQGDGGKMVGTLTEEEGNATDPAWSWWLAD